MRVDLKLLVFCLCVIALPKMGITLGGGVPLYASLVVGQVFALYGWVYAVSYS